jgi:Fe-S cluster assembly protein SufD
MLEEAFAKHFAKISPTDRLKDLRAFGWERFQTLGLPNKKTEAFRYLPLNELYSQHFEESSSIETPEYLSYIYSECQDSYLVFINGSYSPEFSKIPQGVIVLSLAEAMGTYGNFLKNRFLRTLQEEMNPFTSLNAALHNSGVFVYVPPKLKALKPLQCHHIVTNSIAARPRVHLFVGAHSQLDFITTVQKEGQEASWVNGLVDIALEEGAHLKYSQTCYGLSQTDWFFESTRATLKKNSHLHVVSVTTGAEVVRHDYHATLNGEGAEATLQGIWMLKDLRQAHTHVVMDHVAPNCRSMQLFKGVLDGSSKSSFEGKIYVRPLAQKTEAYQLNKHLLLGERVIANSKPNLEIFADDVKASHGSTTTQVDERELFYLKTRGISQEVATQLLIRGFCQEMLDTIPHSFVRERMQGILL